MAGQTIDYDKLAEQHGAMVDYDALAQQHGGSDSAAGSAPQPPEPKSVGGFISNTVGSAGKFVGDVAHAVAHPGQTVAGATGLLEGMAEKSGFTPVAGAPHAQNVDALVNLYKQKYGNGILDALYHDPVGVAADVATLAGGLGAGAKGVEAAADAAKLGRVADVAGTVARGADTVASFTDPLRLATKAAGPVLKLADKGAEATSDALTRGALRGGYNVNQPAADVTGAVEAAKNLGGVPFSQQGLAKIGNALADVRKEIGARVQAATQAGAQIDPKKVKIRLDDLRDRYALQVNPDQDLKDIDKVGANFDRNYPGRMGVDDAQILKVGSNTANAGKYGKASVAQIEAEKALTRGLKEEIEAAVPEIGELNAQQAKLMNLEGYLGKAVNKYAVSGGLANSVKKGMGSRAGMTIAAAGGAAGIAGHAPAAAGVGLGLDVAQAVLSDPFVKQQLAIMINKARELNPAKWGTPDLRSALDRVEQLSTAASRVNPQQ